MIAPDANETKKGVVLKKIFRIPPFGGLLMVILLERYEDSEVVCKKNGLWSKSEDLHYLTEYIEGVCYNTTGGGQAIVAKLDVGIEVLVHEISHAVDYLIQTHNLDGSINGTEVRAYLNQYYFEEIVAWLRKDRKPITIRELAEHGKRI